MLERAMAAGAEDVLPDGCLLPVRSLRTCQ